MIVERITVKNWRGYREPHVFALEPGINLLAGRNEAGKSTLFEALTRVLFDRHLSRTDEIRSIQPLGSSLPPEAEVEFRVGEERYRAVKRFLEDPVSILFRERGGVWERDHEGDKADARLREILRGEATARTAARPEQRSLAQALWYLQTDGALPDGTWSEGVRHGLSGLIRVAARSPAETEMLAAIERAYDEHWTPTGRLAARSELADLEKEIPKLRARLDELAANADRIDGRRADLEDQQLKLDEARSELVVAEGEAADALAAVSSGEEFERAWRERTAEADEAQRELERLDADYGRIDGHRQTIAGVREQVNELEGTIADLSAQVEAGLATRDGRRRQIKNEHAPALKALDTRLSRLRALVELRTLERSRLESRLEKVEGLQAELERVRRSRAEVDAPDEAMWRRFEAAAGRLPVLDAQLEASTVRVSFEWDGAERTVTPQPAAETLGGEYVVTEPIEFRIDGVGTVRIRAAVPAVEELREERSALDGEILAVLERHGVADGAALAGAFQKAADLDGRRAALEERIEEEAADGPAERDHLVAIDRELGHIRRMIAELPEETLALSLDRLRGAVESSDAERSRLEEAIESARAEADAAEANRLALIEERQKAETVRASHTAQIGTLRGEIARTLEPYGTAEHLEKL
jgi:DNA repair protein SbcC/Rad50